MKSAYVCTKIAKSYTEEAANVKDWRLRNAKDREFKEIAKELMADKGYIIATNYELAKKYPGKIDVSNSPESGKMIWGVSFGLHGTGKQKMCFIPIM